MGTRAGRVVVVGMDSIKITDMASTLVGVRVSTLVVVVNILQMVRVSTLLVEVVSTQVDHHLIQEVISSTVEAKQVEGGMVSLVEVVVEDIPDRRLQ